MVLESDPPISRGDVLIDFGGDQLNEDASNQYFRCKFTIQGLNSVGCIIQPLPGYITRGSTSEPKPISLTELPIDIALHAARMTEALHDLQRGGGRFLCADDFTKTAETFQDCPPVAAMHSILSAAAALPRVGIDLGTGQGILHGAQHACDEWCCCYYDALVRGEEPDPADFKVLARVTEPLPRVFHIAVKSQIILASMFLRFQEFYECPNRHIRGHFFSLAKYKAYCRQSALKHAGKKVNHPANPQRTGTFRYYMIWPGFNVPSQALVDLLIKTQGRQLQPQEQALIDLLPVMRHDSEPFYVIGSTGTKDVQTLHHELAHGLYGTNASYKEAALAILEQISEEEKAVMCSRLVELGYAKDEPEILVDEMQAYLVEGNLLGCSTAAQQQAQMADCFNRFFTGGLVHFKTESE